MIRDANAQTGAGRLKELLLPTGEEALLDVEYPRPRFSVPVLPAALVALMLVIGALVAFSGCGGQHPAPVTVATDSVSTGAVQTGAVPTGAAYPGAVPTGTELVVSVVGHVENPGLVTLTPGARVAEALEHASPLADANLTDINHAARMEDGQQVNVYPRGQPVPRAQLEPGGAGGTGPGGTGPGSSGTGSTGTGGGTGPAGGTGKVNLNQAGIAELTTLNGVGEATAGAIVAYREQHGAFGSVEQLMEVSGIGPAKFASISRQVTV